MWQRPTLQAIYAQLYAGFATALVSGATFVRRAFLRILSKVIALGLHNAYGAQEWHLRQLVESTADDAGWLARYGEKWGVARKGASGASGYIQVTGEDETVIPQGTVWVSETGVEYESLSEVELDGITADVLVAARPGFEGPDSNLPPGEAVNLQGSVSGLLGGATVAEGGLRGGDEEESLMEWRRRILQRVQNPPNGGSAADFKRVAEAVPGVRRAFPMPNFPDPGSVAVGVLARGPNPSPSPAVLAAVQTAIDALVGVTAEALAAGMVATAVDLEIDISPDGELTRAQVLSRLQAYFAAFDEPNPEIIITQLKDVIGGAGVRDYELVALSVGGTPVDPIENLTLIDFKYPVLGTVTFGNLDV